MFLQDIQTVGMPDLDHLDKVNLSRRFRYQQNLRETLRRRFRDEYLGLLVRQPKKSRSKVVKVGEVVLIGCDNKKKLDWPMGVVISLLPGIDNCVRVVKLKMAMGELTQPVQWVYPLEVSSEDRLLFCRGETKEVKTTSRKNDTSSEVERIVTTISGRRVRKPEKYELWSCTFMMLLKNRLGIWFSITWEGKSKVGGCWVFRASRWYPWILGRRGSEKQNDRGR